MYVFLTILLLLATVSQADWTTEPSELTTETTETTRCLTADQMEGTCAPYYLCNDTMNSASASIDIHYSYSPCPSFRDICCKLLASPTLPKDTRKGCGWRNPDGVGTVNTDLNRFAKYGEFPWLVAVLDVTSNQEGQYVGSGSLIDRRVVLTTAHIAQGRRLRVRAGEWDTQANRLPYPRQERSVDSIAVHKDYNKKNLFYDIALLFLAQPVDPAPNVGIACLPAPRERAQPASKCHTTGWGKDVFGNEGRYQVPLKKEELSVLAHGDCRDRLRKTRLGSIFELHYTFMCAGSELDSDTCMGDGGSPLVCPMELEKDRFVQNGMVAWGIGCAWETPIVFVDISVLRGWIDNEVLGKGVDVLEYEKY